MHEILSTTHQDIQDLPKEWRYAHSHLKELIIGDPSQPIRTILFIKKVLNYFTFFSHIKSKIIFEAKKMLIGLLLGKKN